ncbi:MAG: insulinase family protein, partial [Fimbriimonadaceae bacterium]
STRIRDLLPNGSAVIVENMPGSAVSIQLFASSRGAGETAATHGWRHLLEHLLLKGRKEATSIDERAESNGIFITGRTYRDAMQIEITCKADQIEMGLAFLDELLLPIDLTQETIDKEIAVMRQEIALEDDAAKLARGAWKTSYGETGIDSLGDPLVMAKATPDELAELQARHFAPANLGLVISGPLSLEKVAEKAKQSLQKVRGTAGVAVARVESEAQRLDMPDAFGELRGARVPGIRESKTGAALIAAFAIASDLPGTFVTYTPSTNLGLVMVGRSESNSGLGFFIDELEDDRKAALFARGRTLALRWAERYKNSPTSNSYWRGLLMCQDQSLRPETVVQSISQVTYAQYLEALGGFSKEKAIIVVGDRK